MLYIYGHPVFVLLAENWEIKQPGVTCRTPELRVGFIQNYNMENNGKECELCQKRFKHIQQHMGTHSGEKPYNCTECETAFTQQQHLTSHMRTHTGEKSYSCTECEKTFSQLAHLTKHMRTHTGEKPYSCTECEMKLYDNSCSSHFKFSRSSHLHNIYT